MTNAGSLSFVRLARPGTSQVVLDDSAAALSTLFLVREAEFAVSPDVTIDYPDIGAGQASPFLDDPVGYLNERLAEEPSGGAPIDRVVILTTFSDRVGEALGLAGYDATPIVMPAGPDSVGWFRCDLDGAGDGRTLYIEAVDEADEKIRPAFSVELRDGSGTLRGGACGSIHELGERRYAYLATMALHADLPPQTGHRLGEAVLDHLRALGVDTVHLGTQTAGPFYERLGFQVVHTVLPRLRTRVDGTGNTVATDLVMMARDL